MVIVEFVMRHWFVAKALNSLNIPKQANKVELRPTQPRIKPGPFFLSSTAHSSESLAVALERNDRLIVCS